MNRSASLRWRVVIAATLFGAVLSSAFALTTLWITEDFEHIFLDDILAGQAEDLAQQIRREPTTPLPRTRRLNGYLREADGSGGVPSALQALGTGVHEIGSVAGNEDNAEGLHVAVYDLGPRRLYLVLELQEIERREVFLTRVMAAILMLGTLLSAWMGSLLASRIIGPVGLLARAVSMRGPESNGASLAHGFADDELGELARSFDLYSERLVAHAERERVFAAEASHGLRTPVAVIRGAAEVMLDDPQLDPVSRERLRRIDRGAGSLGDLLDGLLALARAGIPGRVVYASIDPVEVVEAALREQDSLLRSAGQVPLVEQAQHLAIELPERELQVALRILLRSMAESGHGGDLRWSCDEHGILLRLDPTPARMFTQGDAASDRFVGLGVVARLCSRLGWTLELGADADARLVHAGMRFGASRLA